MRVEIANLGCVKRAKIDLKPLTVFVGPNNSGKTWVAYTLAGILGWHGWFRYTDAYSDGQVEESYPPIDSAIQSIVDEGNAKIDMVEFVATYGEAYLNGVAKLSRSWLRQYLNSERLNLGDLTIRVALGDSKETVERRVLESALNEGLSLGRRRRVPLLRAVKEQGSPLLFFFTSGSVSESLTDRALKEFVCRSVFFAIHSSVFSNSYIFPTERTTYIAGPFPRPDGSNTRRTTPSEPDREDDRASMSFPVMKFFRMVAEALYADPVGRQELAATDIAVARYIELAHRLETEILRGGVEFAPREPKEWGEFLFRSPGHEPLEIVVASSMVKELAPLALYLRHRAKPYEWIIIDEPEMNLHPEAQARLTAFLAMLVNAGLHVLITTHSPYVVDHLVNLMKAASHDDKESIVDKFFLKDAHAFIRRDDVSVYLFDYGKVTNILSSDGTIDWSTFGNISDRISQISFEL